MLVCLVIVVAAAAVVVVTQARNQMIFLSWGPREKRKEGGEKNENLGWFGGRRRKRERREIGTKQQLGDGHNIGNWPLVLLGSGKS